MSDINIKELFIARVVDLRESVQRQIEAEKRDGTVDGPRWRHFATEMVEVLALLAFSQDAQAAHIGRLEDGIKKQIDDITRKLLGDEAA